MLGTFLDIFRFNIWQSKLEKKIPVSQKIIAEIEYSLYTVLKIGSKKLENFTDCPLFQIGRDGQQPERTRP
jgi:hypothetical protein